MPPSAAQFLTLARERAPQHCARAARTSVRSRCRQRPGHPGQTKGVRAPIDSGLRIGPGSDRRGNPRLGVSVQRRRAGADRRSCGRGDLDGAHADRQHPPEDRSAHDSRPAGADRLATSVDGNASQPPRAYGAIDRPCRSLHRMLTDARGVALRPSRFCPRGVLAPRSRSVLTPLFEHSICLQDLLFAQMLRERTPEIVDFNLQEALYDPPPSVANLAPSFMPRGRARPMANYQGWSARDDATSTGGCFQAVHRLDREASQRSRRCWLSDPCPLKWRPPANPATVKVSESHSSVPPLVVSLIMLHAYASPALN